MTDYKLPRPTATTSATSPDALNDNAVTFNKLLNDPENQTTYQGKELISWQNALNLFGFGVASFDFATGGTLDSKNQLIRHSDELLYRYIGAGSFPLVVAPATNPVGNPDWDAFAATSLQVLNGLTEPSDLAQRVPYNTSVSELSSGAFNTGDLISVDADIFKVIPGTSPNEYNKLDAGSGKIATQVSQINGRGGFGARLIGKLDGGVLDAYIYLQGDSTSQADSAWFYQGVVLLGLEYPAYTVLYYRWNDGLNDYDSPSTLQTGTGAQTLHVYNAAQSGQNAYYFQGGRVPTLYAGREFDLIIQSLGLNGDILNLNEQVFYDYINAGYLMLQEYQPNAEMVVTLQNFRLDHEEYCAKANNANMRIAEQLGLPILDFYSVFKWKQRNSDISEWMADLTHPNSIGYSLMADIFISQILRKDKQSAKNLNVLSQTRTNLIRDPYIIDWRWDNGIPVGVTPSSVTVTKDNLIFETGASSMKLVSTSGSNGTVTWDLTSQLANILPNQDLVFMARVYVPSSNSSGTASRLSFNTNIGSRNTFPESSARDGWLWKAVTLQHDLIDGATFLQAIMFMGATGETVYVDRVCVFPVGHVGNPEKPNLSLYDYYSPDNVRQTATNVVSVSGNDVTIDSSSEISPTPSFDLDLYNLDAKATYRATWVNNAASGTVFAKDGSGGGSTVISQISITENKLDFTAISSSGTLRFFVDAGSVPVTTNDIKIIKLYAGE